jgi:hypothetical protein
MNTARRAEADPFLAVVVALAVQWLISQRSRPADWRWFDLLQVFRTV